jgi:site-specific DNA-methyltransferase (adenine-specific)
MSEITNYNPDVLTCLANLSNDEVFTPPQLANQVLDLLPKEVWENKELTFLDPVTKSGIFLREIVKRLDRGLENKIPDKQERINHILANQVFGISITELTSLLARRSLYCSKTANGKYSITTLFDDADGNIKFDRSEHAWASGRCKFCGAKQDVYSRDESLETHAYQFLHTEKPQEIFNMKFDVIVGNPPYQLTDGGGGLGSSAVPIYQLFIQQAKKLNPRYLSMIIPARWYAGGRALDVFRDDMLNDKRVRTIVDFFDSGECFPGVDISGGVCYFLWDRDNQGDCEIISIKGGVKSKMSRPLLEEGSDSFIRFNDAISIVRKTRGSSFEDIVSTYKPFGPRSNVPVKEKAFKDSIKCYTFPKTGYIEKSLVQKNHEWIDKYKVYISKAYGERGSLPYLVIAKPFIGEKGSICSETYLVAGAFDAETEAKNVISYMSTRFFRFLVLLKKNTQNSTKSVYSFVPMQDFSESWTDEKLYKKYKLTKDEIGFIESMVRPMELPNA